MPQLDPASFAPQLVWLFISFVALYFLLGRFALPKIGGVIKARQDRLDDDLSQAETMKCEYCGNYVFIKGTVIKRVSPLISPTGQEALVPIEIYSCGNCGKVPKSMLKGSGIEEVNEK